VIFTGTALVGYYSNTTAGGVTVSHVVGTCPSTTGNGWGGTGEVLTTAQVNVRATVSAFTLNGIPLPWGDDGSVVYVKNAGQDFYVNVLYETDSWGLCCAMAMPNTQVLTINGVTVPTLGVAQNNSSDWYPAYWIFKSRHGLMALPEVFGMNFTWLLIQMVFGFCRC